MIITHFTERLPYTSGLSLPIPASDDIRHGESGTPEEVVSLPGNGLTPPRLLICYSSYDGPAHVKAVMQLGAFIQQHMATQVEDVTFHGPNWPHSCYAGKFRITNRGNLTNWYDCTSYSLISN